MQWQHFHCTCSLSLACSPTQTHQCYLCYSSAIPETKGRSLEEMDVIFGSISKEQRQADIDKQERGMLCVNIIYIHRLIVFQCWSMAMTNMPMAIRIFPLIGKYDESQNQGLLDCIVPCCCVGSYLSLRTVFRYFADVALL